MKKIFFVLSILGLSVFFLFAKDTQAQSTNLIANPSAESPGTNISLPLSWQTENWGTNKPTYTYKSGSAQDGTKSLYINMASRRSGDAKWYFTPVAVTPNTSYVYSDYYKSSVATQVVVKIFDAQGKESYLWLANPVKSSAWKMASYQFKTPANAAKITVFHLINKVGTLETDNFSLKQVEVLPPPPPPIITGNVPNSSFEQTNDGISPVSWTKEKWGTSSTTFTYLGEGHAGTHSAKVQMTSYSSGDAKWAYDPQAAQAGDYTFTDYYKSNVTTQIAVRLIKTDNTEEYIGLASADPSTEWKKYSDIFTIPSGVKQFTVLHFISAVGYLITDDYSVEAKQFSGFNRPIVSLTFDDGWEDNYTSVLPVLGQYGFKSTQFYATTYIQSQTDQIYKIKAFADAGHETGSHTITHPHLPTLPINQIDNELSESKTYLEGIVGAGKINSFATPYGEYNSMLIDEIKKFYTSHRSTDEGYNAKDNFNVYNIRVQNMTNTTTLAQYNEWINKAKQDKTWLVIVYHRIGANPTQFESTEANFNAQMSALSQSGLTVLPIGDALSELIPQI